MFYIVQHSFRSNHKSNFFPPNSRICHSLFHFFKEQQRIHSQLLFQLKFFVFFLMPVADQYIKLSSFFFFFFFLSRLLFYFCKYTITPVNLITLIENKFSCNQWTNLNYILLDWIHLKVSRVIYTGAAKITPFFELRWIGWCRGTEWSSQSPDLTPDLWGVMKDLVYRLKLKAISDKSLWKCIKWFVEALPRGFSVVLNMKGNISNMLNSLLILTNHVVLMWQNLLILSNLIYFCLIKVDK